MTDKSYKEALKVDFGNLDVNLRDHSSDYMDWSEKWADAVAIRDRIKENLDVFSAELDRKIRSNFVKMGIKVTEAVIAAEITINEDVQGLKEDLIEANRNINIYASAKSSFEARKKNLDNLTSLWIGGYFSKPNMPQEIKEVIEQKKVEAHKVEIDKGNSRLRKLKRRTINEQ